MILQVCRALNCERDEIILTSLEVRQLMKYVENNIPIKITIMDFSNTTYDGLEYENKK